MPELSRFLGIIITMYFRDHHPPHFYVKYENYRAVISIENLLLIEGKLPPRVLGLVIEWAELHQQELKNNWLSIQEKGRYTKINPLT
jgi:hypothetical protein